MRNIKDMKIGVLMGGRSPEREISLKTGKNILQGLKDAGFNAVAIDAKENVVEDMKKEKIETAFIALHGPLGEDGTIQGLLEFLDIPYTGAGVLASALSMSKVMTKRVITEANVPTPPYAVVYSDEAKKTGWEAQVQKILNESSLSLPVIVKPSVGGSSIGTTIVREKEKLAEALKLAGDYYHEILVEKFLSGVEITVGVLGDDAPFALPVIEIIAVGGVYNYTTKYQPGMSDHIIPARIPENLYKSAQEYAVKVFKAVGCCGMGRVDFMVEKDALWALEINTIPGMTETSLLPEAAAKAGIDFQSLLIGQLEYGVKRHEKMKEVSKV